MTRVSHERRVGVAIPKQNGGNGLGSADCGRQRSLRTAGQRRVQNREASTRDQLVAIRGYLLRAHAPRTVRAKVEAGNFPTGI